MPMDAEYMWQDRKRTLFGLPWSFTKYRLTAEKLFVISGLFTTRHEEIRLYRILDVSLNRSLGEKLFGLGTLHLSTADRSAPEIDIKRVKHSERVYQLLSDTVEQQRDAKGIIGRELFDDEDGYGDI